MAIAKVFVTKALRMREQALPVVQMDVYPKGSLTHDTAAFVLALADFYAALGCAVAGEA